MDKRLLLFIVLSTVIWVGNMFIQAKFFAPPPKPVPAANQKPDDKGKPGDKGADNKGVDNQGAAEVDRAAPDKNPAVGANDAPPPDAESPKFPPQFITLGSLDPESNFRMLVTLTNRGAAIERVELNNPHYRDIDDDHGYLGQLSPTDAPNAGGCVVQVVGPGTPAEKEGLKPGDIITALDDKLITKAADLVDIDDRGALNRPKPGQEIKLSIVRDGQKLPAPIAIVLARKPLSIIHPEKNTKPLEAVVPGEHDPFSILMTMDQIGADSLSALAAKAEEAAKAADDGKPPKLPDELPGLHMRDSEWEVVSAGQPNADGEPEAAFRYVLPKRQLEIVKRFRLARVPDDKKSADDFKAYHLVVTAEVLSTAKKGEDSQLVAYRLDGPTGLPIEGAWYASKKGIRDVALQFHKAAFALVNCATIVQGKSDKRGTGQKLDFMAVDAQYFAAALLSRGDAQFDLGDAYPIFVGNRPESGRDYRGDTSFRLISAAVPLAPGETIKQELTLFVGPKKQTILEQYAGHPEPGGPSLSELVDYGWFPFGSLLMGTIARAMLGLLHIFYSVIPNYGIAIILLTAVVRLCMFPISKKQAIGAQKMQLIQPELKRIKEKYKNDAKAAQKAQMELFQKHNYHPLSGCLPLLIQLPIFIGLYSSMRLNIDLRQAPLFGEGVRWCSNLAAPDMLFYWKGFMPEFITRESGMFSLGPYFNLLPCLTIGLFILQQRMFMPPAADENAAAQQSMMKYMMVFMGFIYYCVPSGLCLYFIISTSWGIVERTLLPKIVHAPVAAATVPALPARKKR